ncbi:MAG: TRAP transporter small permease [Oscillospiraceae bacterium]|nr:TRAP transporter small permease [Oscillospiraceae bacterium]
MYDKLDKAGYYINKAYSIIGAIFLSIIIVSCSVQTFTRYVLNDSQVWTEETARYAFVWTIMLGATVVTRNWSHASLDFVVKKFSIPVQRVFEALTYLLVMACGVVMVIYGVQLVVKVWGSVSTACHYPISLVYLSIPVSGIAIAYHSFVHFLGVWFKKEKGAEN